MRKLAAMILVVLALSIAGTALAEHGSIDPWAGKTNGRHSGTVSAW